MRLGHPLGHVQWWRGERMQEVGGGRMEGVAVALMLARTTVAESRCMLRTSVTVGTEK